MLGQLRRKWRPKLWAVVALVLGIVLCLPVAGVLFFKVYANQFVHQTEENLLAQGSVLAASYAALYAAETGQSHAPTDAQPRFDPALPMLSLRGDNVLPPRPDPRPPPAPSAPIYAQISPALTQIAQEAQISTLTGYRLLDPKGTVIAGSAELGQSLAHVDEVKAALAGQTRSVARTRLRDTPTPALYRLSWGAEVRIFVALPVYAGDEIVGAVYLSRSPSHIFRFLYAERANLLRAIVFVLFSTALIGIVFWRFITRPIQMLIQHTRAAGSGGVRWQPPEHFGTREVENLSNSFQALTERLHSQQAALRAYTAHVTHELKSPLTAVKGAAELLREEDMSAAQRTHFLNNIERDTTRMEKLLSRMRAYSQAEDQAMSGSACLADVLPDLRTRFTPLLIQETGAQIALPIHAETLAIILTHLAENAAQHGASALHLETAQSAQGATLCIRDDGPGISAGNREKIFTPFFTTRRDHGGTGMGLNIVKSIVETLGGTLDILPSSQGAAFRIAFSKT